MSNKIPGRVKTRFHANITSILLGIHSMKVIYSRSNFEFRIEYLGKEGFSSVEINYIGWGNNRSEFERKGRALFKISQILAIAIMVIFNFKLVKDPAACNISGKFCPSF